LQEKPDVAGVTKRQSKTQCLKKGWHSLTPGVPESNDTQGFIYMNGQKKINSTILLQQ